MCKGSKITVNSQERTVDVITDSYNLTTTEPFTTANNQSFTIESDVGTIPTRFFDIYKIDRLEGDFHREVLVWDIDKLLKTRKEDWVAAYSNLDTPYCAAIWRNEDNRRYLKVYPVPDADKDITIYANVKIVPRNYTSNAVTTSVPLDEHYEGLIRTYLKHKMYAWIKMKEEANQELVKFKSDLAESVRDMATGGRSITMSYT